MTENKHGWLFGFGVYKIHYFIDGTALCNRAKVGNQSLKGQNISKPIELKTNDKRACKTCLHVLQTYSNLKNRQK